MNPRKTLQLILQGSRNIRFADFVGLVQAFGFRLARTRGSHHIFARRGIPELVNLQNVAGQAKPYQVDQFLKLVEQHGLTLQDR